METRRTAEAFFPPGTYPYDQFGSGPYPQAVPWEVDGDELGEDPKGGDDEELNDADEIFRANDGHRL